jgi:transmembrane sensor
MNNYQPYFDLGKLIAKHLQNELTEQEKKELDHWLGLSTQNQEIFNRITDKHSLDRELEIFSISEKERAWENIAKATGLKKTISRSSKLKRILSYAAALFLLFSLGITSRHFLYKKPMVSHLAMHKQDIPPGTNKATLILADGSKIALDEAKRGKIASQENVDIDKTQNGQLIYSVTGDVQTAGTPAPANVMAMNTIITPRGGQYTVILPDGTKVWINAASSLKYPTAFTGSERRVELTGEAYFEVAKNAAKPFFVRSASQTVEVLGTHFNINSYTDEKTIKTTLLEGSVKVTGNTGSQMVRLKPGQQAVGTGKELKVISDADIDEAIAWKNGKFMFRDTELRNIMRQLSRWYDVDVEYQGTITERHYRGRVSRDVPVSQVFEILKTSGVNFTINGRKIIVKS